MLVSLLIQMPPVLCDTREGREQRPHNLPETRGMSGRPLLFRLLLFCCFSPNHLEFFFYFPAKASLKEEDEEEGKERKEEQERERMERKPVRS